MCPHHVTHCHTLGYAVTLLAMSDISWQGLLLKKYMLERYWSTYSEQRHHSKFIS